MNGHTDTRTHGHTDTSLQDICMHTGLPYKKEFISLDDMTALFGDMPIDEQLAARKARLKALKEKEIEAARIPTQADIAAAIARQDNNSRRMIETMNAYNEAMNNLQADMAARRAARSAYNAIRLELIFNIARRAASYAPITSGLCFQLVGVNIALASANAAARGLAREPNQTDMNASAARVNLIERVRFELQACKRNIKRGYALPACDTIAADMAQAAAAAACEADKFEAARKAAYKAVNALLHASRAAASKTRSIYMVDMNGLASDIMLPIVYQRAGIENEHDVKALDIALDTIAARLDTRDIMTLEALLAGHTQAAIARRMGISRMAVCKRVKRLRDNLGGLQGFKEILDIK